MLSSACHCYCKACEGVISLPDDAVLESFALPQVKFLTYALGGADDYHGTDPAVSHRRLHNEKGLRIEHFHIVVGHLQATLCKLGVSQARLQSFLAHSLARLMLANVYMPIKRLHL